MPENFPYDKHSSVRDLPMEQTISYSIHNTDIRQPILPESQYAEPTANCQDNKDNSKSDCFFPGHHGHGNGGYGDK